MKPIHNYQNADEIRKKAKKQSKLKQPKSVAPLSEADTIKLIHELEVHQIEHEMQKEQISYLAMDTLEVAKKYTDLFDFAPIGYFTLDKTGTITSMNLMGANMLGKPRLLLKNSKFRFFVSDGTKSIFNEALEKAFKSHNKTSAEITLVNSQNQSMYVQLNCIANNPSNNCLVTVVDISERKLAEERLQQSEIKFRTVADFTYDWEYWKGVNGSFIYISPSCEKISGYTPEEFMQNPRLIKSIIHPNDAEAFERHYQKAHSFDNFHHPLEIEFRIIKKDGSIAYIRHICQHVLDTNDNNLGLRVSNRDITERKQAEEQHILKQKESDTPLSNDEMLILIHELEVHQIELEMQKAEITTMSKDALEAAEKFTNLFDFAPIGYFTLDKTGTITRLNLMGANMLGKPRLHLKNSKFGSFVSYETKKIFNQMLETAFNSHDKKSAEVTIINSENQSIYVQLNCIANKAGLDCLVTAVDISERKLAEEILIESEARFKNMFDRNYEVMLLIDPETGFILDANQSAVNFYGYTLNELIGMNINKIALLPDEQIQILTKKAINEEQKVVRISHRLSNGEVRTVEVHPSPIDYHKKRIIFSIVHDVSNRLKADEEINQKNMLLQKLNSDKNRFIHILAHDLRNPLLNITGFLAMLKKNIRAYDIEKIENYINTVNDASKSMFGLLEDILKWALANSEQSKFTPKEINLWKVCEEIVEISNLAAATKNISISYAQTAKINVFSDSDMLKTILRNLLSNAIKFSNPNGSIVIKAKQTLTEVIITVSDFGTGMAPNKLNNLFDLAQIHSSPGTEGEKGTGLGLMLCKEFVERHGGKIYAQSTLGKGSDFIFVLPSN